MLRELYIENLAIIGRVRLSLDAGLNVLTGETGAGKSIVIDALELVLGGRASPETIRAGEDRLLVEALFEIDAHRHPRAAAALGEMGWSPGELVLTREVQRGGRSSCRINGRPATVAMVRSLTRSLVELHGQHEHQLLLDRASHLDFLDGFAGAGSLRQDLEESYRRWKRLGEDLEELRSSARERTRRLDLLDFQIREIDGARLRDGEEEELLRQRQVLAAAEKLVGAARQVYDLLYGGAEGSGHDRLALAAGLLAEASRVDDSLRPLAAQTEELLAAVDEVAREVAAYADRVELDPARLAQVEARLAAIDTLKRKYADTVAGILAFRQEAARQRDALLHGDESARELERELGAVEARLVALADQLSSARAQAATGLAERVTAELQELAMASARFVVGVEQREDPGGLPCAGRWLAIGPHGVDQVEFLFTANPGDPPRPLERVASGGELARVMLALKTVLADLDGIPTLVFDEVDAGIGGHAAHVLGVKLARVARHRQVVVVTHLAPVAAFARHHLVVHKTVRDGRADVEVEVLVDEDLRVQELARMVGGARITREALDHARRLRQEAAPHGQEAAPQG
ncbi:MAG: DNA repair protein RecN [Bacillota bacterium]|nr:DNA repair protein RecN [Bacillota bacterium]